MKKLIMILVMMIPATAFAAGDCRVIAPKAMKVMTSEKLNIIFDHYGALATLNKEYAYKAKTRGDTLQADELQAKLNVCIDQMEAVSKLLSDRTWAELNKPGNKPSRK
jgi:hypothetical protein